MKKHTFLVLIPCILFSCARQVLKEKELPEGKQKILVRSHGDTTSYLFEFRDTVQRRDFLDTFEVFVQEYPFGTIRTDTIDNYVRISVRSEEKKPRAEDTVALSPVQQAIFEESLIETAQDTIDTIVPPAGGSASLYYHRSTIDPHIITLLGASPSPAIHYARPEDTARSVQTVAIQQAAPNRIRLTLNPALKNGKSEQVSAFDIVDAWNTFIKMRPAEGKALFRYVKGIPGLIRGEEAIVPGIQTLDDRSIMIHLSQPDSTATDRLTCPFLFPPALKCGPYYLTGTRNNILSSAANMHYLAGRPYLDNISIRLGGDTNPFLGYSMRHYDIITLYKSKDIAYARSKLLDNSKLVRGWDDLYFIALAHESEEVRKFLVSLIDPEKILRNFVQAEGHVIHALEDTVSGAETPSPSGLPRAPFIGSPLSIVFNSGDPLSLRLAEKLLADITHLGLPCRLDGRDGTDYEKAMAVSDYSLAVGWVPERIRENDGEKLRAAAIWFNDILNEQQRIAEYRELPLFSITHYLLCKKNIDFYQNSLAGAYHTAEE
ncbi:MAG: hypothetical protein GF350_11290 [Chitinivibrionales bacterium]|nr:hypothetical protein [Chitinivibrionales bacterium]